MSKQVSPAALDFVPTIHHDTYDYIKTLQADMRDRTVVITGASRGIGQAIAVSYARAGCKSIILLARSSLNETADSAREAATNAGHPVPKILCADTDITSLTSVKSAATKVQAEFDAVDVLVNNAGYMEAWHKLDASDPDDWWKTWEVNIKGTYLITREFLPMVLKSSQKTIVTVSSAGAWFTLDGGSAYEGTKTAQIRLNNHLNVDYRDQGLLAYAVHPGGIKTALASVMPEGFQSRLFGDTLELPADTIVWLTQERREWLADRYVSVNWDMDEFTSRKEGIIKGNLLKLKLSQ